MQDRDLGRVRDVDTLPSGTQDPEDHMPAAAVLDLRCPLAEEGE